MILPSCSALSRRALARRRFAGAGAGAGAGASAGAGACSR